VADIFVASLLSRGYELVFDPEFRAGFPNLTRWFETIANQPIYKDTVGEVNFIDEAPKPPKREEKKRTLLNRSRRLPQKLLNRRMRMMMMKRRLLLLNQKPSTHLTFSLGPP